MELNLKNITILICSVFLFSACIEKALSIDKKYAKLEQMSFEVVEKDLQLEGEFPDQLKKLIKKWFNTKVKINGLDGKMVFYISDYREDISKINDGKRVDLYVKFRVVIKKQSNSKERVITGKIKSYGTLVGTFSLNDFDVLIENTQIDLITRLSRDLKSNI